MGLCTHDRDSLLKVGWPFPHKATFDPGPRWALWTFRIRKPLPYQEGQSVDTRAELLGKMQDVTLKERNKGAGTSKRWWKDAKKLVVEFFSWGETLPLGYSHYSLFIAFLWESLFTNQYHGMGYVFVCLFVNITNWSHTFDATPCNISYQLSHEKKPSYFPLYWLVNRDPYNGLL